MEERMSLETGNQSTLSEQLLVENTLPDRIGYIIWGGPVQGNMEEPLFTM